MERVRAEENHDPAARLVHRLSHCPAQIKRAFQLAVHQNNGRLTPLNPIDRIVCRYGNFNSQALPFQKMPEEETKLCRSGADDNQGCAVERRAVPLFHEQASISCLLATTAWHCRRYGSNAKSSIHMKNCC
ncbi:hypothetical protein [Rhizobium sp. WL3]|uniref:hypothetical protein n=1 Tax=Rhizobium sp. WL3 TaxID=2603277 RepID=UPI0016508DE9|nr:hypothetical protein [Rhizobium sp. WL3]